MRTTLRVDDELLRRAKAFPGTQPADRGVGLRLRSARPADLPPGVPWRAALVDFTRLCQQAGAKGNRVPDAFLAALAIESGCEWVTADAASPDFPASAGGIRLTTDQVGLRLLMRQPERTCALLSAVSRGNRAPGVKYREVGGGAAGVPSGGVADAVGPGHRAGEHRVEQVIHYPLSGGQYRQ